MRKFTVVKLKWIIISYILIIIYTAIAVLIFNYIPLQEYTDSFVKIIPWLIEGSAIISLVFLLVFRKHINKLLDTLQAVADGNFVIAVDTSANGEYETAYKNLSLVAKELQGSKQEMQQFTNEFLHEFKTPITAIHGFAEHLIATGEGIETPERMQYLKIISDESIRLSDLSQKNLMLANVEACQIVTDKSEYDLSEQIKNCAILLLPQIEKKSINLEMDVENLTYYGNAELMEQVWINLLNNAIKFTPENGEIAISAAVNENSISVEISDSGIGMDEETMSHIFEKYYQGAGLRKGGGSGIGLSIVQRIVTLCGGEITVKSAPNEGSKFRVILPK